MLQKLGVGILIVNLLAIVLTPTHTLDGEGVFQFTDEIGRHCVSVNTENGVGLDCEFPQTGSVGPPVTVQTTQIPTTPEPTATEIPEEDCWPGYGWGDTNHCHSGPPGH